MKEKYYYIGEVSSLLDISTQTLRYYDKIGLVRPAKVNEQNGYRQYTYDQIHYIERIKYLQNLGLPLTEIRMALDGTFDEATNATQGRSAKKNRSAAGHRRYDRLVRIVLQLSEGKCFSRYSLQKDL